MRRGREEERRSGEEGEMRRGGVEVRREEPRGVGVEERRVGGEGKTRIGVKEEVMRRRVGEELPKINPQEPNSLPSIE